MANNHKTANSILVSLFFHSLLLFSLQGLLIRYVSAQTVTSYSPTNGSTPVGLAPGTPAGSYALSGFDSTCAHHPGGLLVGWTILGWKRLKYGRRWY
jgi:hypothetical protein